MGRLSENSAKIYFLESKIRISKLKIHLIKHVGLWVVENNPSFRKANNLCVNSL